MNLPESNRQRDGQREQPLPSGDELRARTLELLDDRPQVPSGARMVALGYTRASSAMQVLEGDSLEDQEVRIARHVHQQGWHLLEIVTDPAYSGRSTKRPGFSRVQRLVRFGQVQVLVVDRIDRIARDLRTFLQFIDLLRRCGVQLVSLREGIDFQKPWGRFVIYVLGALAELYSDNLSQEMRIKHLTDARAGKLSSTYRFGYCKGNCSTCSDPNGPDYCPCYGGPNRHGGAFRIPHPIESHAVKLMFDWYASGAYSYADVARRLNQEIFTLADGSEVRFRTKGRPGVMREDDPQRPKYPPGRFDVESVREIISNAVYAGYVTYAGSDAEGRRFRKPRELFDGRHQPLVDPDTFHRAQLIRRGRFQRSQAQVKPADPFPLSRLLICSHRHSPLRALSVRLHRYYADRVCQIKHGSQHQPNLRADELDAEVRGIVGQIELPGAWVSRVLSYLLYDEGDAALMQDRLALQQRLESEQYLLREGVISASQHHERRTALVRALAQLEPESAPACREAAALLANLPALLDVLTSQEENLLYRHMFFAIVVGEEGIVALEVYPPFLALHPAFTSIGTHRPLLGLYPIPGTEL